MEFFFVVVRLDRSVHLESVGKTGFGKCYDSQCVVEKGAFLIVNLGQMGHFRVYKHRYVSMINLVSNLKQNVDYRSIKYYTHQHVILCTPFLSYLSSIVIPISWTSINL